MAGAAALRGAALRAIALIDAGALLAGVSLSHAAAAVLELLREREAASASNDTSSA